MGEFLSAREVLGGIDQKGNRDGIATLEDIRPYLNVRKEIPLAVSPALDGTETKFRQALSTLSRICKGPEDVFQMSPLLKCGVVQKNEVHPEKLKHRETVFVRTQLDRIFDNPQSDDRIRQRYKEFLFFSETNKIPVGIFIPVLENRFFAPLETTPLEKTSLKTQQESLFQLSLYAAIWHLKHNVKAFAPEALAGYPEWFRKKVEGFEDDVLDRIGYWKSSPSLGRKETPKVAFVSSLDSIITPESEPFPPILGDLLGMAWHELFHLFRVRRVRTEAAWIAERDANLVEALAVLKSASLTDPDDKRLQGIIRKVIETDEGPPADEEDRKGREIFFNERLGIFQYALLFSQDRKKLTKTLEERMEAAHITHVFNNLAGLTFKRYPAIRSADLRASSEEEILNHAKRYREETKRAMSLYERESYDWPPGAKNGKKTGFLEMIERMNVFLKDNHDRLTGDSFDFWLDYSDDVESYASLFTAHEYYGILIEKNWMGKKAWWSVNNYDFGRSLDFIRKHKWLFLVFSPAAFQEYVSRKQRNHTP